MISSDTDHTALLGQARKLQAMLESAVDAIITIDGAGIITTVNPAAARLFGYPESEFLGRNVHFLMPEPYHSAHDGYIANYRSTGDRKIIGVGREVTGRRQDGSTFPMHLAVSEFVMDGRVHFTGIIHDLSSQKSAEQALRHANKMEAMGQLTVEALNLGIPTYDVEAYSAGFTRWGGYVGAPPSRAAPSEQGQRLDRIMSRAPASRQTP